MAAETVEAALSANVAEPEHDSESGESVTPEGSTSEDSDIDRDLEHMYVHNPSDTRAYH